MTTKAKQTAEQYDKASSEGRKALQPLFNEKNKRREAIKTLFVDDKERFKRESKLMRSKLNEKWISEHAEQIKEYQRLGKEHKENEKTFQQLFAEAKKWGHTDLSEEDFRAVISGEEPAFNQEKLLNKPNMTPKDKVNMEKSIKFLVDNKMDTTENLKKLESINYGSNYIEIGGVKRARENHKAEPNKKNIFKHGNEVYFKFDTLKEQNKLLAKQGMEIPGKSNFVSALKALPGEFTEDNWYMGGNILGNILDLSMSGGCNSDGKLFDNNEYGCVWSSSERDNNNAWVFRFSGSKGGFGGDNRSFAFAVRPVLK